MILISRTRKKIIGLEGFGLKITKQKIIKMKKILIIILTIIKIFLIVF
jgi:hypothetical protein